MIKKIDLIFFLIVSLTFLSIFLNFDDIKFSNDSINYLQNSLLINSYFYNLDIKFNEPTSYPILYPLIISFFLSKSESLSIFGCIDRIENCSFYLHEIIILNLILFILSSIVIFFISQILFNRRLISYISSLIFLINSYYFSRIFFVDPEILSIFIFLLSFYFLISFLKKKSTNKLIILILLFSLLFLIKPIFIIINSLFFGFLFLIKKIYLKEFVCTLIIFLCFFQISDTAKKKFFKSNGIKYELIVIEQRTAYGKIKYNEIIPLFFSFIPKINNTVLSNLFKKEDIERIIVSENMRNYFYNNRDLLNNNKNASLSKIDIVKQNLKNFDKQMVLTPIFLFRGLFMQAGKSDFYDLKRKSYLKNIFIYFNYIFFSSAKIYLFFLCLKFSIFERNEDNFLKDIFTYLLIVFICHSVLTHNLPRYTSILFGIGTIFLIQKIYILTKNFYKK